MRRVEVEGQLFECPRYVRRVQGGWQTYLPDEPTRFFADGEHAGVGGAHEKACAYRFDKLPWQPEDHGAYFQHNERSDKREPLGVPGVFLVKKPSGRVELQVKVRRMPMHPVTVGHVSEPWRDKLPQRLEVAREARERLIKQRDAGAKVGSV